MSLYFGMASLETDGGSRITGIMRTIFFSFTEILFIWYSWRRSEIVFRQESSDQVMFIAHILMWITTLACLVSPVILLMPQLSDETAYFNAKIAVSTGGLGIFVLDVFFAVSYTRHIFKKTTEVIEFKGEDARATQYYPIIAKFGFCSSASLVFALGFYVGASVISSKSITNPSEVSSYYFLLVLTNLAIFSTAVALVIMKVKLVNASRGRTILNTASK
ncbi:hypothetical protein BDR26DRAFT_855943 [Obelidium mucronatum]|nr:hypothetical protein BDR26DRAFT_855943 [Obelidium mucronatum]